jgi:DNA invertase Pin-like site-specific DNA recombinase
MNLLEISGTNFTWGDSCKSLAHLVQLVSELEDKGIGLVSLNDPIDTTAQSRLVFRNFASLADFEIRC